VPEYARRANALILERDTDAFADGSPRQLLAQQLSLFTEAYCEARFSEEVQSLDGLAARAHAVSETVALVVNADSVSSAHKS
jgi:hypothetical protein